MEDFHQIATDLRREFSTGKTRSIEWRKEQLRGLLKMMSEQDSQLCAAVKHDLNKNPVEVRGMELFMSNNEAVLSVEKLEEWTKPQKVAKGIVNMMDSCYKIAEPYGVVLILGAWNYPLQLTLVPLIGAIAAGNCVILKPSEVAEASAKLLADLIPKYLDTSCVRVVQGGVNETTSLLKERFDYIFYTGNSTVGKVVMEAASKYLTPVTLELGGKSPCYVDHTTDVTIAARRVAWGKFVNCGQTCIAPDYVLCNPEIKDELVQQLRLALEEFYGKDPLKSDNYGRIINSKHFARIKSLIPGSGKVVIGGDADESKCYISPTVVTDVQPSDKVMQDEVFGPVLPVMEVKDEKEAIEFINSREKPLALYVFTNNDQQIENFISQTSSGGVCINDCLMHCSIPSLPFGGVGSSGMGVYHGKFTFEAFSHYKPCMVKSQGMEGVNKVRYPPYTASKAKWIERLMKKSLSKGSSFLLPFFMIGALIIAVFLGIKNYSAVMNK